MFWSLSSHIEKLDAVTVYNAIIALLSIFYGTQAVMYSYFQDAFKKIMELNFSKIFNLFINTDNDEFYPGFHTHLLCALFAHIVLTL